jgi:hypothetical protein
MNCLERRKERIWTFDGLVMNVFVAFWPAVGLRVPYYKGQSNEVVFVVPLLHSMAGGFN